MPMTRSQARLRIAAAEGHSIPETTATEPLLALANSSTTDEINRNSSLFNQQTSSAGPPFHQNADGPSDDRDDDPSSRTPSVVNSSHQKWRYPLLKDENIPCIAPEDVHNSPLMKRPAILAMSENAKYMLDLNEHALGTKGPRPFFSLASPRGPSMPAVSGSRPVQNWSWPSFLTTKPPQPSPSAFDPSQNAGNGSQEAYEQALQVRTAKVEKILDKVNCLADLTENVVRELIESDYGLLTISKFKVTLVEWGEWSAPMKANGLPVDLHHDGWEHITIQCGDGPRNPSDAALFAEALAALGIFPLPTTNGPPEQGSSPLM